METKKETGINKLVNKTFIVGFTFIAIGTIYQFIYRPISMTIRDDRYYSIGDIIFLSTIGVALCLLCYYVIKKLKSEL